MKKRMIAALLIAAALQGAQNEHGETPCPEERGRVCTADYAPVCAVGITMQPRTFSNACTACAEPRVSAYVDGACPKPDAKN